MCRAFSCLIHRNKTVTWKFGVDSHEDLIELAGYKDDEDDPVFARIEISPKNNDYLNHDAVYKFKLDEERTPSWWSVSYENKCWDAHEKWLAQLNKILVRKAIIHPFVIAPPKEITDVHIALLREWGSTIDSVRNSVGASVEDSVGASVRNGVGDSVGASVRNSVRNGVGDSVGASVRNSVGDSVWAYYGSFFLLDRTAWRYTECIKTDEYPFLPLVKLWEQGLVPSFDGMVWRLHGGKNAEILWSGKL